MIIHQRQAGLGVSGNRTSPVCSPQDRADHDSKYPSARTRNQLSLYFLVVAALALLLGNPGWQAAARSPEAGPSGRKGGLEVIVRASQGGLPVAGARVSSPDLKLAANSDASGRAAWNDIDLNSPTIPITVTVSGPCYVSCFV
jgi:hypothetical protein